MSGYLKGNTTRSSKVHLCSDEPFNYTALCGVKLHPPSVTDFDPDETAAICSACLVTILPEKGGSDE